MAACNCDVSLDLVALLREDILQCLFPRKKERKLKSQMTQLLRMKVEIYNRVEEQKQIRPGMRSKGIVDNWVEAVNGLQEETIELGRHISKQLCIQRWCSCSSRYSLGGRIIEMLQQVEELLRMDREFQTAELLEESPPPPVEKKPTSAATIVGTKGKLSEILSHLQNYEVRIIGIYGAGGIGKTTLMTDLNNMMLNYANEYEFDVVIWVTVSQDADIHKVQKQIGDRLHLRLMEDPNHRATTLFEVLKQRKFLILLDNLWKVLNLTQVGIPVPGTGNNGKIVFTTRSYDVCVDMTANKCVQMNVLDPNKSWELFSKNLGSNVDLKSNVAIRECAAEVVRRCCGLPLALITVAKAFGSYGNNILGWESGLEKLMSSPSFETCWETGEAGDLGFA